MPHLTIFGIPGDATQEMLEDLADALQLSLSNMPALGIKKENVFIFFPADRMMKGLGEEIICHAVLFEAPERTPEVRKEFAENVTRIIQFHFHKAMAKCMVFSFDRALGYSTRNPKE